MAHQGSTHDQHMKPGQKSSKSGNDKMRSASSASPAENKSDTKDKSRDQSMKSGSQDHKNKH